MKNKLNLLMITLLSTVAISYCESSNTLTHTEKILIDIFHDKGEANKQISKNIIATTKETNKLAVAQSLALQNYERALHTLENKLNSSVHKFNTTLKSSDDLLKAQKAMLKQYKKTSTISLCAMSAVLSSALTVVIIEKIKKEVSFSGLANRVWNWCKELVRYNSNIDSTSK